MRRTIKHIALACSFLIMASCTHKDLCYHHPHTAKVSFMSDWSKFEKETPTGMTVMVYPQQGSETIKHLTHDISNATLNLPVCIDHSIIFNQSESEYGSVSFRGMDSYETAEVYTNSTKSSWYKTRAEDERVVTDPEWIGTSRHEGAEVTQQMVDATGEDMLARTQQRNALGFVIAEHTPQNIIYTVTVTVHVKGFHNLRSARASLDGLAEGYYFGSGKYSKNSVTQLIENWQKNVDEVDPTKGTITATITCFGLPEGHTATPEENRFSLSILLVDNKTVMDYTFDVGDRFENDNSADVKVSLSLDLEIEIEEPLPDVKPEGGSGSGFDATVDEWGDEENVEIEV